MSVPYRAWRELLDSLNLHGPCWQTTPVFDDRLALFAAVCSEGLGGCGEARRRALPALGEAEESRVLAVRGGAAATELICEGDVSKRARALRDRLFPGVPLSPR